MFSLVAGVYESYFASPQVNILVVGAQGAGKTTTLERLKVTHFRKRPPQPGIQQTAMPEELMALIRGQAPPQSKKESQERPSSQPIPASPTAESLGTPTKPRKRLAWVCPAPKRYSAKNMKQDDDDEEVVELLPGKPPSLPNLDDSHGNGAPTPPTPPPPGPPKTHLSSIGSLDSVELPPVVRGNNNASTNHLPNAETAGTESSASSLTPAVEQFDLQPRAKMISLNKIRPTIGMNLGKVELCQAKCHVWDLGGRLVDLWERYYADCDAVCFVWKLGKDVVPRNEEEDDDDDERPEITYELQQSLLNQVRSAIGDDIPFLILGHAFGANQLCPVPAGTLYQTDALLPHYHNPLQAFMVANAATGQGIQAAMEWLVPLAKRQQAVRERSMEKLP